MIKLGQLIGLLATVAALGMGGMKMLKRAEVETAKSAVEAHKKGYVSIQDFHKQLMQGEKKKRQKATSP